MKKEEIIKQIEASKLEQKRLEKELLLLGLSYDRDDVEKVKDQVVKKMEKLESQEENNCKNFAKAINDNLKEIKKISEKSRVATYFYLKELGFGIYYFPKGLRKFYLDMIIESVDNLYINSNRVKPNKDTIDRMIADIKTISEEELSFNTYMINGSKGYFQIDG